MATSGNITINTRTVAIMMKANRLQARTLVSSSGVAASLRYAVVVRSGPTNYEEGVTGARVGFRNPAPDNHNRVRPVYSGKILKIDRSA